jgi:hypothetical protein
VAGGRFALLVATDRYEDPDISQLTAPGQDAEALARVLSHSMIGAFDVKTLINAEAHIVRRNIEAFFSERKRDDTLLLYFSGHGMKDPEGHLHFIASDTHRKLLQSTGVAAAFVNEVMRRSRSRQQILIIDSCYSGAFARGMLVRSDDQVQVGEAFSYGMGRAVITASDAMQYAFEGDELKGSSPGSVFTRNLIRGLESGEADQDNDGWVSFDEMYDYLYERVTKEMPEQVPRKWVFDVEGDLIVARNGNPREANLPPEIKEALADSRVFVREGAVRQLGSFLKSDHPGLVKAARRALQRIAEDDDSRSVSSKAAVLLNEHESPIPDPASVSGHELHPRAEIPDLPRPQSRPGANEPGVVVGSAPPQRPEKAVSVAEDDLDAATRLTWSIVPLMFLHTLAWSFVFTFEYFVNEKGQPLAIVGAFFGGLCAGWTSGALTKRLAVHLPNRATTRISLGWGTIAAVLIGGGVLEFYRLFHIFFGESFIWLATGTLGMLGGLNTADAIMPIRSPHSNRRWLASYASGWAAAVSVTYTSAYYYDFEKNYNHYIYHGVVITLFALIWHVYMVLKLNKDRISDGLPRGTKLP